MTLRNYFESLIAKVESSDIGNDGKDPNGFFEPTRIVLLQKLNLLRDLHGHSNPRAKAMVRSAWAYVSERIPMEWLILSEEEKRELKKILS